ncbi:hypothetical protein [Pseudomonas asiatica]|uniref:hypothetical protein n=1 Tax=Pseudomonas asiatica TaxID=2219225 RepID=UPI0018D98C52|nr:hypothetical protein [Pseudomonas asiatica]MBH3378359.1 hypothetical protein [Pseudomonas asiatica]
MITADYGTLLSQAGRTAEKYMDDAIDAIDKAFGEGYAKKHPDLVGAFMQTAAADFSAACVAIAIQEHAGRLSEQIFSVADELMERLDLPPRQVYS